MEYGSCTAARKELAVRRKAAHSADAMDEIEALGAKARSGVAGYASLHQAAKGAAGAQAKWRLTWLYSNVIVQREGVP